VPSSRFEYGVHSHVVRNRFERNADFVKPHEPAGVEACLAAHHGRTKRSADASAREARTPERERSEARDK